MSDKGFIQLAMEDNNTCSIRGNFSDLDAYNFIKCIIQERPAVGEKLKLKLRETND